MEPIRVDAVLLRGLLPDIKLAVGTTLLGRVLERHAAHGLLNLAGAVLVAELPDDVEAGQRLRLAVAEVGERVVLRVVGEAAPAAAGPQPPPTGQTPSVPLPLPGDAQAQVRIEAEAPEGGGPAGAARAVTVHYDSPALGRIEVRLALGAGGLVAGVGAGAGEPVRLAGAHADELRAALARAMRTPVDVHVGVRRERVDLRA
jgi:hypothetical protein